MYRRKPPEKTAMMTSVSRSDESNGTEANCDSHPVEHSAAPSVVRLIVPWQIVVRDTKLPFDYFRLRVLI